MATENELERLEGFVSRLLLKYNELQEKNKGLTRELAIQQETISRLRQDAEGTQRERFEIDEKITSLVDKIEQWEEELAEKGKLHPRQESDYDSSEKQGKLFDKGQAGNGGTASNN